METGDNRRLTATHDAHAMAHEAEFGEVWRERRNLGGVAAIERRQRSQSRMGPHACSLALRRCFAAPLTRLHGGRVQRTPT